MNKDKATKKKIKEYVDYINESIEYGSFETAIMYATNLISFIKELESGQVRYCEEHNLWEEK